MKWFDKWFQQQAKKAWEAAREDSNVKILASPIHNDRIESNGINMKLYVANGGYIVEFLRWDNVKDRHLNELHVINEGEKLGERLSEVIVQYILSNR
jgi:hypothetical protein